MDTPTLDDLRYDWPPDVLNYESYLLLGLSHYQALVVVAPALGIMFLGGGLLLAGVAAVGGFLLMRKFEGLGERNVIMYLLARLQHQIQAQTVTLPLILPTGHMETVVITDLEGNELVRIGRDA